MTDYKTAPVALKRGLPAEQKNGMFGAEDRLIALGVSGRFTAVVTIEVADIRASEADVTQWPVIEFVHVEPIWSAEELDTVKQAQEEAYKERTGANQLNFEHMPLDAGDEKSAADQEADDAAFEAAAPKKKPASK